MKKATLLFSAAAAILLAASSAQAAHLVIGAVSPYPNDTFTFDVLGFNTSASGPSGGAYVVPPETGSFGLLGMGTTTTYSGAGYDGQNITMTTSEVIGASTTTDTFTVSTDSASFLNEAMIGGVLINSLQFDIGNVNSATAPNNPVPVSVLIPITSYSAAGNTLYGMSSTSYALDAYTTLGSGGTSYTANEGLNAGVNVAQYGFHSFTYSITYNTLVPEPSTWAMLGLGSVAGVLALRRRRAAGAC